MLSSFFFIGLPYIALASLIAVSLLRYHSKRFSYSALSSQFLESKQLLWGSIPWHIGIFIVLAGHLLPFLFPGVWQSVTARAEVVIAIEAAGVVAAFAALVGLVVLLVRRLVSRNIQAVTTPVDLVILGLLIAQVLLGVQIATAYRWGSMWAVGTTTPYLWSLLTFRPDVGLVESLPPLVRVHIGGAWIILLLLPFSRLVHAFSFPLQYLWRAPQQVIWTNARRIRHMAPAVRTAQESRRLFLKAAVGLGTAGGLLSIGVLDKFVRFFSGPDMTTDEQAALLKKRLERLEMTAQERELELERIRNDYILVAQLKDLSPQNGKYFIDYQMRPALAYRDAAGLPQLISAKCTHLGCTVSSSVDANGRLLCPCHMSFFDMKTGAPQPGSPATKPLPLLGWALMNAEGKILMSRGPDGKSEGEVPPGMLDSCSVYIAKRYEETA